MESCFDSRGKFYVDCAECNRGGNGSSDEKCSCGHRITKVQRGGCFIGELMGKYKSKFDELRKKEMIKDVQKMGASKAQVDKCEELINEKGIPTSIHPLLCDNSCIMMEFSDISIGVETDGHAHS